MSNLNVDTHQNELRTAMAAPDWVIPAAITTTIMAVLGGAAGGGGNTGGFVVALFLNPISWIACYFWWLSSRVMCPHCGKGNSKGHSRLSATDSRVCHECHGTYVLSTADATHQKPAISLVTAEDPKTALLRESHQADDASALASAATRPEELPPGVIDQGRSEASTPLRQELPVPTGAEDDSSLSDDVANPESGVPDVTEGNGTVATQPDEAKPLAEGATESGDTERHPQSLRSSVDNCEFGRVYPVRTGESDNEVVESVDEIGSVELSKGKNTEKSDARKGPSIVSTPSNSGGAIWLVALASFFMGSVVATLILQGMQTATVEARNETPAFAINSSGDPEHMPTTDSQAVELVENHNRQLEHTFLERSERLLSAGDDKEAFEFASKAAAAGLAQRALCFTALGRHQSAIQDANSALTLDEKSGMAYLARGHAQSNFNLLAEGKKDLTEAIALRGNDALPYALRAMAELRLKNFESAITDSNRAIRLDARNAIAFAVRAESKWLCGANVDSVTTDCDEALRLDDNQIRIYAVRAWTAVHGGRYAEARTDLRKFLWRSPKTTYTRFATQVCECLRLLDEREYSQSLVGLENCLPALEASSVKQDVPAFLLQKATIMMIMGDCLAGQKMSLDAKNKYNEALRVFDHASIRTRIKHLPRT